LATDLLYAFWALLLLLTVWAASVLGKDWTRIDRAFALGCVPAAFLLLGFVPKVPLGVYAAAAATAAVSATILGGYLTVSTSARPRALALAGLMGIVDAAGLSAIYLSAGLDLNSTLSRVVLLLFASAPIVATWAIEKYARRKA